MSSSSSDSPSPLRILIINPNTSTAMTAALEPMLAAMHYRDVSYTFFTCPSPGIPSINSPSDAAESARLCWPHLLPLFPTHDAFLVACYSQHPLVGMIRRHIKSTALAHFAETKTKAPPRHVTGIFEASVVTSLSLIDYQPSHPSSSSPFDDEATSPSAAAAHPSEESFGIVSTEKIWDPALTAAVHELFGTATSRRYAGCETTGLSAIELHDLPAAEVRRKMIEATVRLVQSGEGGHGKKRVGAICLGCAGMVGLDEAVREGCKAVLGEVQGEAVRIVDGVKAGVGALVGLCKGGF